MNNISFLLDPAFFVWNDQEYDDNPCKYWQIVEYVTSLFDLFEENKNIEFKYDAIIASIILDHNPFKYPAYRNSEFRDFVNRVSIFLANPAEEFEGETPTGISVICPDIHRRPWFDAALQEALEKLLSRNDCSIYFHGIVSHDVFISSRHSNLVIQSNESEVEIPLHLNYKNIEGAILNCYPKYEQHVKHDPIFG